MRKKSLSLSIAFLAMLSLGTATVAHAQPAMSAADKAKAADIKKLMTLTGAGNLGIQAMTQMLGVLKQATPKVPEAFWVEFQKEVNPDDLVDRVVPIYAKHLSHPEIKELIRFYETPLGKKLIATLPAITQESMVVGQQWGMDLANRARKKLDAPSGAGAK
jgi:hypothetical protein